MNSMTEYRGGKLAVIWMASEGDREHAKRIGDALETWRIRHHYRVGSAHKTPEHCLAILRGYAGSEAVDFLLFPLGQIVYCTIAGRSDGLSGLVAANSRYPVIACPPPPKNLEDVPTYLHSSLNAPSDAPVAVVQDPKNAALAIVKIFGLGDEELRREIEGHIDGVREKIVGADRERDLRDLK